MSHPTERRALQYKYNSVTDLWEVVASDAPVVTNATGAGAINTTYAPAAPFWLESVTLRLSAAPAASEDFVITLDASNGAIYDVDLSRTDLSVAGVTHLVYTPDNGPFLCGAGDAIDVTWANSNTRTYGLRIISRLV